MKFRENWKKTLKTYLKIGRKFENNDSSKITETLLRKIEIFEVDIVDNYEEILKS